MLFQTNIGAQFKGIMQYMEEWGVFDAFLPFLLIFTIIFALLQQIKIFKTTDSQGQDIADRKINGIIAFTISALIVLPHVLGAYPETKDPINIINKFLPSTIIIIIAILFVLLLTGLVGANIPSLLLWTIGFFGVAILVIIFLSTVFPNIGIKNLGPLNDPHLQALIVILIVFGLVVYFITKEPSSGDRLESWKNFLQKMFGSP